MEEAGAEGYRLQEQLDVGNKHHGCQWLNTSTQICQPHIVQFDFLGKTSLAFGWIVV